VVGRALATGGMRPPPTAATPHDLRDHQAFEGIRMQAGALLLPATPKPTLPSTSARCRVSAIVFRDEWGDWLLQSGNPPHFKWRRACRSGEQRSCNRTEGMARVADSHVGGLAGVRACDNARRGKAACR
jgi:hypothetical protein